jgi:hypothetical protein
MDIDSILTSLPDCQAKCHEGHSVNGQHHIEPIDRQKSRHQEITGQQNQISNMVNTMSLDSMARSLTATLIPTIENMHPDAISNIEALAVGIERA